jgi:solute:Na+ symporter, SSS family
VLKIVCTNFWPGIVDLGAKTGLHLPQHFWFNAQVGAFLATVTGAVIYMIVSLATSREPFNLDKMLHRGAYSVEPEGGQPTMSIRDRFRLRNILRFDHNFTRIDKLTAGGIFWWAMAMLILNVGITVWCVFSPWPIAWWANYWLITGIIVPCIIAVITLIWFGIGGFIDIRDFFHSLRTMTRDARDDGRVMDSHNLADEPIKRGFPAVPASPANETPAPTTKPPAPLSTAPNPTP